MPYARKYVWFSSQEVETADKYFWAAKRKDYKAKISENKPNLEDVN